MAKIRLWDVKKPEADRVASPSPRAPQGAVSPTVTTEDYYNSPLARQDSTRISNPTIRRNSQIDGLRITSPLSGTSSAPQIPNEEAPTFEKVERIKVLKKKQRRRQSMSVAVSEEEEEMLRIGAAKEGMTFSAWARKHLFRAMKQKIPTRPRND